MAVRLVSGFITCRFNFVHWTTFRPCLVAGIPAVRQRVKVINKIESSPLV
jgi:hypothetical protein